MKSFAQILLKETVDLGKAFLSIDFADPYNYSLGKNIRSNICLEQWIFYFVNES